MIFKGKEKTHPITISHMINLAEDEKQKLVEYRKQYYRMKKKHLFIIKYFDL